ncbi:hypothetical protein EDD85DRAFT_957106 [Armillaria nabsnona]|nr:hypothetical protein EDD85DRAFT_957106 [Armillaria nabsnona]
MAAKLALQMVAAKAEPIFITRCYSAYPQFLVRSADSSRPERMLLPSPIFKLQTRVFRIIQANIPTEPFLAILVAMLCANLLPGHSVRKPPPDLLSEVPDGDEEEDGSDREEYTDAGDEDGIPSLSLQVATNVVHVFIYSEGGWY